MMNKVLRQRAVLEALRQGPVANQEDLQRALRKRGFKVGQATLSRDIHDLKLIKTSDGYAVAATESPVPALPPMSRLEDTLAAWDVAAAREAAWNNAELLAHLGDAPVVSGTFLDTLDGLTAVASKALLVPVP